MLDCIPPIKPRLYRAQCVKKPCVCKSYRFLQMNAKFKVAGITHVCLNGAVITFNIRPTIAPKSYLVELVPDNAARDKVGSFPAPQDAFPALHFFQAGALPRPRVHFPRTPLIFANDCKFKPLNPANRC